VDAGITVFVPAYNEVANLQGAVEDVLAAVTGLRDYEVIIVDDGSTDGPATSPTALARTRPGVRVIHQPTNLGLRHRLHNGAGGRAHAFFTFVPGDREVSAESIRRILSAVGSADIVVPTTRTLRARPWYRRVLTRGSTAL